LGWQYLLPGAGKKIRLIAGHFGSPRTAWEASAEALRRVPGVAEDVVAGLVRRRAEIDLDRELKKLGLMGVSFVCCGDPGYPESLRAIFDPPPALFVRGELVAQDAFAVAVVGTRRPSYYGVAVAEKIGRDLAVAGVTVVSGMARGIDTAAHRGALKAGGRTVAVLGCGPDVVYPRENRKLMEQIMATGAVVSEFPPGTTPDAWHFPVRNRVISGLAKGVVVVEAAEKSGALITADFALEQGREVMAVPGNVTSPSSKGSHWLIKQGAALVESAEDVLDELGIEEIFPVREASVRGTVKLSNEEEVVYRMLSLEPVSMDFLIQQSGISPQEVAAALMFLEVKGMVKQLPGKFYVVAGL